MPAQFNAYMYSANNPVTFSDPSGLVHEKSAYWQERIQANQGTSGNAPSTGGDTPGGTSGSGAGQPDHPSWYCSSCTAWENFLLSPVMTGIGDGLRSDIGTNLTAIFTGIGDGVSFGLTELARDNLGGAEAGDVIESNGFHTFGSLWAAGATLPFGGASGTAAKLCSFAGATSVLMADGSQKPIDQVAIGDLVIASDPETGEQEAKPVEHVFVHEDTVVDLVVAGEVITTTEDHPFWSVTDARFERADELAPGELVLAANGSTLTVGGLAVGSERIALAYNLSVEGIHTFHVGAANVLVHNTCHFKPANADEHFDKHVLGLDDAGNATRKPDMPEYNRDGGFEDYVADARSLMCGNACPAGTMQHVRNDGVIIRWDVSNGRVGMRDGDVITTFFRPRDPQGFFHGQTMR